MHGWSPSPFRVGVGAAGLLAASLVLECCSHGEGIPGEPAGGASGGAQTPQLERGEASPGLVAEVLAVEGGTRGGGTFGAGDTVSFTFSVTRADGSPWTLGEVSAGRAMLSGPTHSYQRVIVEHTDLVDASQANADGTYTYTFPVAIPSAYLAPYNDSPTFDASHGEMTGQALVPGTYTLGVSFEREYEAIGRTYADVGEAVFELLFEGAEEIVPRAVVSQANCERCHVRLEAHGGRRRQLTQCLMCHTAGAEDSNDPMIEGGTPGLTIDFRVMDHKIHNAAHLPSLLGKGVNENGLRVYDLPPRPYRVVDADGEIHDFSAIGFPAWPARTIPMPRDFGHSDLSLEHQAVEDEIRTGVVACALCHGDPDGTGPLQEPAQGRAHREAPSRLSCGACHDDIDWMRPYGGNSHLMPPQENDDACGVCHVPDDGLWAVGSSHLHPLRDPAFPRIEVDVLSVVESGVHDGDGTIDVGEKISVTFGLSDSSSLGPRQAGLRAVVSGPTVNPQLLLNVRLPGAALLGAPPFTMNLPARHVLEFVGDSTAQSGEGFATARAPHWDVDEARTEVKVRIGEGWGDSVLQQATEPPRNFIDVSDATGFERGDYLVMEDGVDGAEEYLCVQWVEGSRLWFSSPSSLERGVGPLRAHAAGTGVREVVLVDLKEGLHFTVDAESGVVEELIEFGAGGAVLVSYTADYLVPESYPAPLNESLDIDQSDGDWAGLSVVDGTYTVGVWGSREFLVEAYYQENVYRSTSAAKTVNVLFGSATELTPNSRIASGDQCLTCHQDLTFHEGLSRGFEACILCHGTAGAEDLPRYVAGDAPATPGRQVDFRTMLHSIHAAQGLEDPLGFEVIGSALAPYPGNFEVLTFEDILFPARPGRTSHCARCHGDGNEAWKVPAPRDHPTQQTAPARSWGPVCVACHDSAETAGHVAEYSPSGGAESCSLCHGDGATWSVDLVHFTR